ncbi:MAG: GNAT family N-acetyltransferase [Anaerolineae bacterium]|nr:GNAT family N-acetyltransferase [Anaerolineae bacterium]
MIRIETITESDESWIEQAALLLTEAFPDGDWGAFEGARQEVRDVLEEGSAFCAVDGDRVVGWIGGLHVYHGKVWELHPLVVAPAARRSGIGRALVAHLEDAARAAGAATIMLGTDDEDGRTTLSQIDDLYPLLPGILCEIASLDPANPHPVDFYRSCGYAVVGVLPDANGVRKPDIYMAKRL